LRAVEIEQGQRSRLELIDLAGAVVDGHRLLPKGPQGTPER
jgi:hypothetical protein